MSSMATDAPTARESSRLTILYRFCRMQFPDIALRESDFHEHLHRCRGMFLEKSEHPLSWAEYLEGFYALDWHVCIGCLTGSNRAWEILFAARTGRSDTLLIDALRARACRLYPRDEERQENAVVEFWSHLIVPESETTIPVLARYDGQRPLAPWLIRVFQNWHLTKLRKNSHTISMDADIALPFEDKEETDPRWHDAFREATHDWLGEIAENEQLILGLRWRYRMSQRDVASLLDVHEGTISRQTDKLRDRALDSIGKRMVQAGWTGDDLNQFVLNEMGGVLIDDPRLSADALQQLLAQRGKSLPASA